MDANEVETGNRGEIRHRAPQGYGGTQSKRRWEHTSNEGRKYCYTVMPIPCVIECDSSFVCQDVKQRPQKKKKIKKNKKKDKSLIEESILRVGLRSRFPSTNGELTLWGSGQMQPSKSRTGSSRTRGQLNGAEGVAGRASRYSAPSTSKHRPEEPRQGEEGPLSSMEVFLPQQDVKYMPVSAIDETHATVPSPGGPATSFTPPLALTATEGHVGYPDHRDLRSGYPEFTGTTGSSEQLTPIGDTASRSSAGRSNSSEFSTAGEALYDFYGGEQRKKLRHLSDDLTRISSGTRVTTTNSIGQNPRLWTGPSPKPVCLDGDRVPILDLVDGSVYGRTNGQGIFEKNENNGCDMGAGFSVPMVEDQFELHFGTTFNPHPHLVWEPAPYNERIDEQQDDIVLEDCVPECAEDSAMGDSEAESRELARIATAPRMVQLPSAPLVVSSDEYVSLSGTLRWPSVETPSFVETVAPIFGHPLLHELHAPNSVALQELVFPQFVPLQGDASLLVSDPVHQSSTPMAEIISPEYQEPLGSPESPIPVLGADAGRTASSSSHSPPLPSPPRAVSTPGSPLTFTRLSDHQRGIEGASGEIDSPQAINTDTGTQSDSRYV